MNTIKIGEICNKRIYIERIICKHLEEEKNINDLLVNFFNYCKLENLNSLKT